MSLEITANHIPASRLVAKVVTGDHDIHRPASCLAVKVVTGDHGILYTCVLSCCKSCHWRSRHITGLRLVLLQKLSLEITAFYISVSCLTAKVVTGDHGILYTCVLSCCKSCHWRSRHFVYLRLVLLQKLSLEITAFYIPASCLAAKVVTGDHGILYTCVSSYCKSCHWRSRHITGLRLVLLQKLSLEITAFYVPASCLAPKVATGDHCILYTCVLSCCKSCHWRSLHFIYLRLDLL
jgi:hypothetical protein